MAKKNEAAKIEKKDVYGIITERIVALLEAGTVPWRKTWKGGAAGSPRNLKSGKTYRGVNVFILSCQSFSSAYWVTFNQAKELGGSVKKGSRGTPVVFWNWIVRDAKAGERADANGQVRIPFLRYYTVFNVEQCEGLKTPADAAPVKGAAESIDAAEAIVASMPNAPAILKGSEAFYRPSFDDVTVPELAAFESPEAYYSTLFHELGHATGHKSRLNRSGVANPSYFGSHSYSQEELVAEMTAAFLCGEAGIASRTIDNSASYLASWLKALKNDPKMLVLAAAQAQKAADFILDRKAEETAE